VEVEALLGQHAFCRLVAGLTVDITSTAADDALHLRVPSWKQQEPHTISMRSWSTSTTKATSQFDTLLTQPPILELRGIATQ
jgi:hypothetical protein